MDARDIQADHAPQAAQAPAPVDYRKGRIGFSFRRLVRAIVVVPWVVMALGSTSALAFAWLLPQRLDDLDPQYLRLATIAFYIRTYQHFMALSFGVVFVGLMLCGLRRSAALALMVGVAAAWPIFSHKLVLPDFVSGQTTVESNSPGLRVMSANLWVNNRDVNALVAEIERVDPDVLVVQELTSWQWQAINEHFSKKLKYSDLPRITGVANIWSKYPLKADPVTLTTDYGAFRATQVDWNGKAVAVYGVHLVSPSRAWAIGRNRQQVHQLLTHLHTETRPTIIVGDFNATSLSAQLIAVERSGLKDAFKTASTEWLGLSWRPREGQFAQLGFWIGARIDHLFYSPEFKVASYRTGNDIGSDHLPIIVELQLPDTKK